MQKDIPQNTGHTSETKKEIYVYEAVSNLIKDKEGVYIYRKAEKICKAYFLLTQHIQDGDSIKNKLRALALDVSSKTLDLVTTLNKTEDLVRSVATASMGLVSVSDIAVSARLVSESNYTLVVRQVQLFIEEVEIYWKTMFQNNQVIPVHMFEVEALDASYKNTDSVSDMHTDNKMSFMRSTVHTDSSITNVSIAKSVPLTHKSKATKVKTQNSTQDNSQGNTMQSKEYKNERQTLILETIRTRGESSIKDLTDVIKGCSEKTIQRELISLVSMGSLLKTGERRWSRYSVAV